MYIGIITSVSEVSTGGTYEVKYTIYNETKTNQWDETASFNVFEYPTTKDVQGYIKKRIKFYEDSNSVVTSLKKEIGKEITSDIAPGVSEP